jgi:uncharacterized protein YwqG
MIAEKAHSLIRKSKLAPMADQLIALLRQTISLKTHPVSDETNLAPGISKLGGLPDLPPDLTWPRWDEQPLPLIAQIRLSDIASYDQANELPHSGILYFFFSEAALETAPLTPKSWRVIYYEGDLSNLQHTPLPSEDVEVYPTRTVTFSSLLTLPPLDSLLLEPLNLSFSNPEAPDRGRDTIDAYLTLHQQLDEAYNRVSPYHQLLGHPFQIQSDLLQEYQRDTHYSGNPTDWRLLLQIDSDDDLAMLWGDVGMLYFSLPQQALAKRDFSQTHLIIQSS